METQDNPVSQQQTAAPAWSGTPKAFASRFFEKPGRLADKWEHYLAIYEAELSPYVSKGVPVGLLEIGVQNGGSLELWSDYLPAGSRILGIDSDPRVGEAGPTRPNVSVIVHDATDDEGLRAILGNSTFDIIIDDGSHVCDDVIKAFQFFFDFLSPGGKFIIEDLHTSYFPSHGGGFRAPCSSIEWLKTLVDALNADHVQPGTGMAEQERSAMQRLNALIARVTFYDSVAVVEKLPVEKLRPYRRVCGGVETPVVRPEDWVFMAPPGSLEKILFAHPAARHVESSLIRELASRQSVIEELRGALVQANAGLEAARQNEAVLAGELTSRDAAIEQLRATLSQAETEHDTAHASSVSREQTLLEEIRSLRTLLEPAAPQAAAVGETTELCARILAVVDE